MDLLEPKQRANDSIARADDRVRQPAWTRSWPAPSYRYGATAHAYALQVLDEIMGNGATSRLYRKLVVEQQLAVSASASYEPSKRGPPTSSLGQPTSRSEPGATRTRRGGDRSGGCRGWSDR